MRVTFGCDKCYIMVQTGSHTGLCDVIKNAYFTFVHIYTDND